MLGSHWVWAYGGDSLHFFEVLSVVAPQLKEILPVLVERWSELDWKGFSVCHLLMAWMIPWAHVDYNLFLDFETIWYTMVMGF